MAESQNDAAPAEHPQRPEGEHQAQAEALNGDANITTVDQEKQNPVNTDSAPVQSESVQQRVAGQPDPDSAHVQVMQLNASSDSEYVRKLMDELERRIELCETAIGSKPDQEEPAGYESSLVLSLCRLQQQASAVLHGSLAELDGKYAELRVWLESEHISAASLLLTLQAKRDLILQQEEQLLKTAAQLRSLQGLSNYINPPTLSGLDDYRQRMHALETQGNALATRLVALEKEVTNLATTYSTTMNMLSSVIQEWHVAIEEKESKKAASRDIAA